VVNVVNYIGNKDPAGLIDEFLTSLKYTIANVYKTVSRSQYVAFSTLVYYTSKLYQLE